MAKVNGIKLDGIEEVVDRLGVVGRATLDNAIGAAKVTAANMENYAKQNREWTDRTGNARRSITGSSESKTGAVVVYLAIGVDYGPPLELGFGGRYAIIRPTIDVYRSKYLEEYKGILGD
jgi:hypothetical protein